LCQALRVSIDVYSCPRRSKVTRRGPMFECGSTVAMQPPRYGTAALCGPGHDGAWRAFVRQPTKEPLTQNVIDRAVCWTPLEGPPHGRYINSCCDGNVAALPSGDQSFYHANTGAHRKHKGRSEGLFQLPRALRQLFKLNSLLTSAHRTSFELLHLRGQVQRQSFHLRRSRAAESCLASPERPARRADSRTDNFEDALPAVCIVCRATKLSPTATSSRLPFSPTPSALALGKFFESFFGRAHVGRPS
jgi:hypothetical protein